MQLVPIQAVPNQSFSVTLDGNNYVLGIKYTNGCMSVSIVRNTVQIIENMRVVAGQLVIPFRHLESGNFFFTTANQQLPNYEQFNITQQLIYLSADELATLRERTQGIVTASDFDALGRLPLRFAPKDYSQGILSIGSSIGSSIGEALVSGTSISMISSVGAAAGSSSVSGIGLEMTIPVYRLDAGLSASYSGSGQTFADSLGNAAYDHWLGSDSVSGGSDPTFNGVAGANTNAEYFSGDGGDFFTIKANTTFVNSLHKDNAIFTWYGFVNTPTSTATGMLCGSTGGSLGVGIYIYLNSGQIQFGCEDGVNNLIVAQTGAAFVSTAEACLIALSYNENTGAGMFYKKNAAGTKLTSTFTTTYNAAGLTPSIMPASHPMQIWARGGGSDVMQNGCQLWQSGMFDFALSELNLDALWTQYHATKLY